MDVYGWLSEYWWALLLLVALIIFIVYLRADYYTQSRMRKLFSGTTLVLILFALCWFLWYKYGGRMEISEANRWMPIFLALMLAGYNYIGKLRYETQQFKSPNFHGSFSINPFYCNGFYIFAIDGFNSGGLSWPYAKRIAVVREETVEMMDDGAVCIARLGFVSKYELPEEVQQFIEGNSYLRRGINEIYYGWFDDIEQIDYDFKKLKELEKEKKDGKKGIYAMIKDELGIDNPKISTLYWLYRNQSKAVGKQTEWYDATVESVEKGVEHGKRVRDAYVDKREQQQPPDKSEGYEEGY